MDGLHAHFSSWPEFRDRWGGSDSDRHVVFRWDWFRDEPEAGGVALGEFVVHWVSQEGAVLRSASCAVSDRDEPEVRRWLECRSRVVAELWAPVVEILS